MRRFSISPLTSHFPPARWRYPLGRDRGSETDRDLICASSAAWRSVSKRRRRCRSADVWREAAEIVSWISFCALGPVAMKGGFRGVSSEQCKAFSVCDALLCEIEIRKCILRVGTSRGRGIEFSKVACASDDSKSRGKEMRKSTAVI